MERNRLMGLACQMGVQGFHDQEDIASETTLYELELANQQSETAGYFDSLVGESQRDLTHAVDMEGDEAQTEWVDVAQDRTDRIVESQLDLGAQRAAFLVQK